MKIPDKERQLHPKCVSYSKEPDTALIEIKYYEKGATYQIVTSSNEIVAVHSGEMNLFLGQTLNKKITEGSITILPFKQNCIIKVIEDTTLLFFRLGHDLRFCDHLSLEMLNHDQEPKETVTEMHILSANGTIKNYFTHLTKILHDGLHCGYLLKIKLKEFLYLFRNYYSTQELKVFFAPILCEDYKFSLLVMKIFDQQSTVGGLAKKMNYSVSGFTKRFKRIFGISPLQWMQAQKAQSIYHEITCSAKTITELGYEFDFSSPSHFNNFCKKMFKDTPGVIRKKNNRLREE